MLKNRTSSSHLSELPFPHNKKNVKKIMQHKNKPLIFFLYITKQSIIDKNNSP
ncbi:hypothetical protein Rumal_3356 (plasmid) [Ruminococcus albus 7 = DSM 20455]|uniref:Uncharacterized protein n=1 Tax=Ruminococcus albus (strain ATCC 27210 / DSM 20455 / JCM 14654 / NCDO 2250 / 7) TaxID=697329 RepID=E6UJH2_RUMA7|nr:hypothetical protein Rumal_3356 [Ruminococcus albus 7 = DSM 20455]